MVHFAVPFSFLPIFREASQGENKDDIDTWLWNISMEKLHPTRLRGIGHHRLTYDAENGSKNEIERAIRETGNGGLAASQERSGSGTRTSRVGDKWRHRAVHVSAALELNYNTNKLQRPK